MYNDTKQRNASKSQKNSKAIKRHQLCYRINMGMFSLVQREREDIQRKRKGKEREKGTGTGYIEDKNP